MNAILDAHRADRGPGANCCLCGFYVRAAKPRVNLSVENQGARICCEDCAKHDDEVKAELIATAEANPPQVRTSIK